MSNDLQRKIVFRASIAQTQSALKFGGDVGRITFEVPQSDVAEAVALIALQGVGLKITVEVDDGETNGGGGDQKPRTVDLRAAPKRK